MTDEHQEVTTQQDTRSHSLVPYVQEETKTKSILDSITAKWLMWIITALVVPVTLTSLYNGVSTLEEHSRILSGIQITLNDIKTGQDEFKSNLAQLNNNERQDQTDIAVLKSEVERPRPPEQAAIEEPHHFRRQRTDNPVTEVVNRILKPIGKALKDTTRRGGRG